MKELSENEALYRAAAQCSAAERCVWDVEQLLVRWGVAPEAQERIVKHLLTEKYIDENRFCRFFVNDKLKYNKWGRVKITQALRQKHIVPDAIEEAMDAIDPDEYAQTLQDILQAKKRTLKAASDYERNGKLIRFAMGRGFEMDEIRKHLNTNEEDE